MSYSKYEATNFNADIENTDDFESFKYKAKLLGNTDAHPASTNSNGILKNATTSVPLKYLSNFWRSREMPLISVNNDANNIIFTIKDTKMFVPVVTLSARENRKLPKLFRKGF